MNAIVTEMRALSEELMREASLYLQPDPDVIDISKYDEMFDRLFKLEGETGIVLSGSPTRESNYDTIKSLPKENHERPMLSLDKTKDREVLRSFIGNRDTVLSWKMDGLTIVLTYEYGELAKAVTRGNGIVGEVVTQNAEVFKNIPLRIPYEGKLVVRGEAIIKYSDFERINETITDPDLKYKNPRNLCSGSVRQLDSRITAGRNVQFYAFDLVSAENLNTYNSKSCQFNWLRNQGFEVVEYRIVTSDTLDEAMEYFIEQYPKNDFPSDGLVALYDDIAFGESLGTTAKFPRNAFAFKWADEVQETRLLDVKWNASRTGLINPVAVFEPVELEGTTVSRASVHNISAMKDLELGIGDTIQVYKANMIIPQIAENLTRSGNIVIPKICPVCHGETVIKREKDSEMLYCTNPECAAKRIKSFTHFASRDAMNIEGLSEATIEKFIANGYLHSFDDIYELRRYSDEIVTLEGFGDKSFDKLMKSIDKSKKVTLPHLLYAIGIPNVGLSNAKLVSKYFDEDIDSIINATEEDIAEIDGIGPVIANEIISYFNNKSNRDAMYRLLRYLKLEKESNHISTELDGLVFVITGSMKYFANRNEMKAYIESLGGKVSDSISNSTDYLINNDISSNSSKNRKAMELNIPILSEDDFMMELVKNSILI